MPNGGQHVPFDVLAQRLDHLLYAALYLLVLGSCGFGLGGVWGGSVVGDGRIEKLGNRGRVRILGGVGGSSAFPGNDTRHENLERHAPFFTTFRIFLWNPMSAKGLAMAHTGRSSPSPPSLASSLVLDGVFSFFSFLSLPIATVEETRLF